MRNLTLKNFNTILAVHKTGKITTAAELLSLTPPAVTLQLQQIEAEIGSPVFLRTKTGMILTEAGALVLKTARHIVDEIAVLEDSIKSLGTLKRGTIRIGVVSTGKYFAPRLMAAFMTEHPGIEIKLHIANRYETITKLKNYEIDLALMGRPPDDIRVRATLFGDHPLVFISRPDHPLASQLDIGNEQLAMENIIIRERGSGTRVSLEIFMNDVREFRENLHRAMEMDSNETIKQAVIAGLGIAFISGHTIEQECNNGSLVILDVKNTPIRRQWFSITRLEKSLSPSIIAFEEFLTRKGITLLPLIGKPYTSAR